MRILTTPLFLGLALALGAAAQSLPAQAVYAEDFLRTGSGNLPVGDSQIAWEAYRSASADVYTNTAVGTGVDRIGISNVNGPGGTAGFLFAVNQSTASQTWAALDTFSAITPGQITWDMGNSDTGIQVRLLVQSNGNWYATSSTFATSTTFTLANFQAGPEQEVFNFTTSASSWLNFELDPGTSMGLGSAPVADLSTSITGIGFYVQHSSTTNQTVRLDNLMVDAIPEPGAFALLALGMGTLSLGRRNRITSL